MNDARLHRAGGLLSAAVLLAGTAGAVSTPPASASFDVTAAEVLLTAIGSGDSLADAVSSGDLNLGNGTALIMGPGGWPVPGDTYSNAILGNYLQPMGFTGSVVQVSQPWTALLDSSWGSRNTVEVNSLVSAVNRQLEGHGLLDDDGHYAAPEDGDAFYNAENPLVIVGYSESAAAASKAMEVLNAEGIPPEALHFVLLGNTAAPGTGFLANIVDVLDQLFPGSQQFFEMVFKAVGLEDLLGLQTPTDLYPTEVIQIPGDLWSDLGGIHDPGNTGQTLANAATGFVTHLGYVGLSADQVDAATLAETTGDLNLWTTAAPADMNLGELVWNTAINMGWIPSWLSEAPNWLDNFADLFGSGL